MPGEDARETARTVTGEVGGFPFLPELPARGPGADMVGRSAGMLVDVYAHLQPSGWRVADRPGLDSRRARSWLGEDLDALEEFTQGYTGPLKVQATGPWTLAAGLELKGGEAALRDPGACRDLAASLAEGLRAHLAEVRRRVPGAEVVLQLDEPSVTAVLTGRVATASGYRTYRAVDRAVVEGTLRDVIGAAGATGPGGTPVVVHSCAPDVPFALLHRAGAAAVSYDAALLAERRGRPEEEVGEAVEAGLALFAGVVPATADTHADTAAGTPAHAGRMSDPAGSVEGVRTWWRRLGLPPQALAGGVVVTPACGLAGADPEYARRALAHCVRAAGSLARDPE